MPVHAVSTVSLPFAVPSGGLLVPAQALIEVDGTNGWIRVALVTIGCALAAAAIRRWAGLGDGRAEITATLRAMLQLGLVGLVITAVLGSWWATAAFVVVMLAVASFTSARRLGTTAYHLPAAAIVAGSMPVTVLLLLVGLLPAQPIALVPTAGILIGNAMTATTLAGRRALDSLTERRGEYEAGLSIGLPERDAALLVALDAAKLALVPGLDQTRTVGLVTLPGAFVGTLLGGASPMQAAALQLLVLVGILLSQSIAVTLTLDFVVRGMLRRSAS